MNPVLKNHINNFNNPHQVTADQVGAPSDQEFSNHVNDKTNPHQVTAVQSGALPITGGTVNGAVTINGNLNLGNGEIIINDGTMNVQAGGSINFQTPTLTQNGLPIGGSGGTVWNVFNLTNNTDSMTLGPYEKIPKRIIFYPGGFGIYNTAITESGAKNCIMIGGINSVPQNIGGNCTATMAFVSNGGVVGSASGVVGPLAGSVGAYTITIEQFSSNFGAPFFPENPAIFITCAFFD